MTSMLETTDATVRLPITVTKNTGAHKSRRFTATYGDYPRSIEAEGATAAEAKDRLTAMLATAITAIRDGKPRFARDDDGAIWAAVPNAYGGSVHWRVTDKDAWGGSWDSRPASEAFGDCYHMTVIPER